MVRREEASLYAERGHPPRPSDSCCWERARKRTERKVCGGGRRCGGGRQKLLQRSDSALSLYGLRWTEERAAGGGEWGSGKVATRSRCCTVWPPNTRLEVTKMTHSLKSRCEIWQELLTAYMLEIRENDRVQFWEEKINSERRNSSVQK